MHLVVAVLELWLRSLLILSLTVAVSTSSTSCPSPRTSPPTSSTRPATTTTARCAQILIGLREKERSSLQEPFLEWLLNLSNMTNPPYLLTLYLYSYMNRFFSMYL